MSTLIILIFVLGYLAIACEHFINVDKTASAILTAVLCWTVLVLGVDAHATGEARHHLGEISEILFFLLGAMLIVEIVDTHEGFRVITDRITARGKVPLLWIVGLIAFFLSAVLDNLTTTIVMISMLRKLVSDRQERWFFAGIVVVAANAGGAWSPIGDVTTTMLWIGSQITPVGIMSSLLLPSLVCLLVPAVLLSFRLKGDVQPLQASNGNGRTGEAVTPFERKLVLGLGIGALLSVPVFKAVTHLPPYMGMLLGLGVLWVVTQKLHQEKHAEEKRPLSVAAVLQKVDTSTILFFLGILLAVSALSTAGHLTLAGDFLSEKLGNIYAINIAIGLLSSVVDNVPLVAGAMKMYPLVGAEQLAAAVPAEAGWLAHFVMDGHFWELLAYCAGTGGSCLIIGSAAGVAAMGMEKIDFFWYLRNVSGIALLGYLAGAFVYIGQVALLS